jgi:hypothetical protein
MKRASLSLGPVAFLLILLWTALSLSTLQSVSARSKLARILGSIHLSCNARCTIIRNNNYIPTIVVIMEIRRHVTCRKATVCQVGSSALLPWLRHGGEQVGKKLGVIQTWSSGCSCVSKAKATYADRETPCEQNPHGMSDGHCCTLCQRPCCGILEFMACLTFMHSRTVAHVP